MKGGKESVEENILAVENVKQNQVQNVGEELSKPGPECDINVDCVLLVAPLDCLRFQSSRECRCIGQIEHAMKCDRVEDYFRNAHHNEVKEPVRSDAKQSLSHSQHADEDPNVEFVSPDLHLFANLWSWSSSCQQVLKIRKRIVNYRAGHKNNCDYSMFY